MNTILNIEKYITKNVLETEKIAEDFGRTIKPNDVILLNGNLGTGKTVFTSGLVKAFNLSNRIVSSPTFTLLNVYKGDLNIFHIDLYRLGENSDIFYEEVEEVINLEGITIIEWGLSYKEEVIELSEGNVHLINLKRLDETSREITIEKNINN